jgi:hypothetical protein
MSLLVATLVQWVQASGVNRTRPLWSAGLGGERRGHC